MVLDLEMEKIPRLWDYIKRNRYFVLFIPAQIPTFTQSNAFSFTTSIGGCVCLANHHIIDEGSIASWETVVSGTGPE